MDFFRLSGRRKNALVVSWYARNVPWAMPLPCLSIPAAFVV